MLGVVWSIPEWLCAGQRALSRVRYKAEKTHPKRGLAVHFQSVDGSNTAAKKVWCHPQGVVLGYEYNSSVYNRQPCELNNIRFFLPTKQMHSIQSLETRLKEWDREETC